MLTTGTSTRDAGVRIGCSIAFTRKVLDRDDHVP
jgi:hypothetical protein